MNIASKFFFRAIGIFFVFLSSMVFADTYAYRNTMFYDIFTDRYALLVVYTNPVLPNQPVYAWRTHLTTHPENQSYEGKLLGYTDSNGILTTVAHIPNEDKYCGQYINEQFAVGHPWSKKSEPLSYFIYRSRYDEPVISPCRIFT